MRLYVRDVRDGPFQCGASDRMDPNDLKAIQCALMNEQIEASLNAELDTAIMQPLASLVLGSYTTVVEADGTEVFSNNCVTIRVPPSCVKWNIEPVRPTGPLTLPLVRQQALRLVCAILNGASRPSHISRDADELLQSMLDDPASLSDSHN